MTALVLLLLATSPTQEGASADAPAAVSEPAVGETPMVREPEEGPRRPSAARFGLEFLGGTGAAIGTLAASIGVSCLADWDRGFCAVVGFVLGAPIAVLVTVPLTVWGVGQLLDARGSGGMAFLGSVLGGLAALFLAPIAFRGGEVGAVLGLGSLLLPMAWSAGFFEIDHREPPAGEGAVSLGFGRTQGGGGVRLSFSF